MVLFAVGVHMPPRRTAPVIQQKGADFSVRGPTAVSGGPGVTIIRGGVEIFAGTAYITADEVEMHEQGPTIEARGNVKISILGVPRA
jgi:hypothetical protein